MIVSVGSKKSHADRKRKNVAPCGTRSDPDSRGASRRNDRGAFRSRPGRPLRRRATLHARRRHVEARYAARVAEQLGKADLAKSFKDCAAAANPNTMRRFIYWARYLHEKGRHAAALTEIQHLLDKEPNDAEVLEIRANVRAALRYAAPLPSESAPGLPGARFSDEATNAFVEEIST